MKRIWYVSYINLMASCSFFCHLQFSTVAHRGKTQLNFCSETQQSFEEHNNLLDNATIFFTTQQSFREHNNLFQNTTIFSRTQQSIWEHNNLFQNTRKFPDAQQYFPKHSKIFWYTNANQNTTKLSETQQNFKALVTNPDTESDRSLGLALVIWPFEPFAVLHPVVRHVLSQLWWLERSGPQVLPKVWCKFIFVVS